MINSAMRIHRHIGGLEKFGEYDQSRQDIHRHIGGLEMFLLHPSQVI